jgi:hypothetical protein
MKIKVILISFISLFIAVTMVDASSFSSFLPGGKNYLEYDNFIISQDMITSIDQIRVKSNTTYTLSLPGSGNIENTFFYVESDSNMYINGYAEEVSNCDYDTVYTTCTFTTTASDEYINIEIEGMFLSGMFSYYNGEGFQLEEGSIRTEYEDYIIPLMDSNDPEFNGNAAFIMAYHDNFNIEDIIGDHIVVIDDIDGDISANIEIISDDYTSNKGVVGEYLVELKAMDQAGNTAYFTLTIVIKDELLPSIIGPEQLDVNIDENLTIEEIISGNYSGTDGYEGSVLVTTLYDDYSINSAVLGSYDVTLTTSDISGNIATKGIVINIVDIEGPTLYSSNNITIYMSDPKDINEVLNQLDLRDNYYSESGIESTIVLDGYSSFCDQVGTYNVDVLLEDASFNSSSITLHLTVIDDIAPLISGPDTYLISYTDPHTINQIIELFTVSDNYDNLSTNDVTVTLNTYTSRNTDIGTFTFEVEVTDSSLNVTSHSLEIVVVDDQAPIIYIDDYLVTLSANASFSPDDALGILISNHELPDQSYTIKVLNDEYSGNEENPGTYLYSLVFTDDDGTSIQKDFVVKVQKEEQLVNTNVIVRNIIVYAGSISFLGFVIYKTKK